MPPPRVNPGQIPTLVPNSLITEIGHILSMAHVFFKSVLTASCETKKADRGERAQLMWTYDYCSVRFGLTSKCTFAENSVGVS